MDLNAKIDGYKHSERISKVNKGCFNMIIVFKSSGKEFETKRYRGLKFNEVKKIENILLECTLHNLNEFQMARTITFLEILNEIERVAYHVDKQ